MFFYLPPFKPITLFQQQKRVIRKCRSLLKFLTAQKWLILGVKLESLEAQLRPVEQLDKRPPWKAEGRTIQEQLSRSRDWMPIVREVWLTNLKCSNLVANKWPNLPDKWMNNIVWRVVFLAYFFWLLKRSKSRWRDSVRKTSGMVVRSTACIYSAQTCDFRSFIEISGV